MTDFLGWERTPRGGIGLVSAGLGMALDVLEGRTEPYLPDEAISPRATPFFC